MPFILSPNEAPNSIGIIPLPSNAEQLGGASGGGGGGAGAGDMTVGSLGFNHGFDDFPANTFGSVTNNMPNPPNAQLLEIRQSESTNVITVLFSGNGILQDAWSDLEVVCPGGTIMLNSITDISVYNPNFGPNTIWTFGGATQPFLGQTADDVIVPYTFT